MIRVLIADDHPVYLDGLVSALEATDDLEVVAACVDGEETLRRIRELEPDVAALDFGLPGLDAAEIVEALDGAVRVLVFSARLDGQVVYDSVQAGAAGYIPKSWARSRICDAIRTVAGGGTIFAEEVHDGMGAEIRRRAVAAQGRLTTREREILSLLAEGRSAPQIATQLYLSVSTVKTHQHRLYEKLGVADRAAAVAEAMRRGLIR